MKVADLALFQRGTAAADTMVILKPRWPAQNNRILAHSYGVDSPILFVACVNLSLQLIALKAGTQLSRRNLEFNKFPRLSLAAFF